MAVVHVFPWLSMYSHHGGFEPFSPVVCSNGMELKSNYLQHESYMMRAGGNFHDEGAESLFSMSCTRLARNQAETRNFGSLISKAAKRMGQCKYEAVQRRLTVS